MIDNEIKIRIKIIAGYLLVTLLTIVAGWWMYANIFNLVANDEPEYGKLYEKSTLTSAVISYLYQVDYYGNRLTQSYSRKALNQYNEALGELYATVDSLQTKIVSEHQSELVDKLLTLLNEKHTNTLELAKIRVNASKDNFYERSIEEVLRHNLMDSIDSVVIRSTISNDTIQTKTPIKRSFFQRIGDVFAPQKTIEENQRIVTSVKIDTLRTRQPLFDSVTIALEKAKEDVVTNQLKIRQSVTLKLQKLIATEQQISAQIALIITELSQEAAQSSIDELTLKRDALKNSGRVIATVAVVAIVMIVVFLFFILKDISRSSRYKRELEQARIHAEELMRSRHRMLLNISHDIKAPLCSITGYLDLMEGSIDANVQKWAESMKISTSYIMDLLTNLLEYARLETGKSVTYISVFDLDLMIDDVVKIFTPIAQDKGIFLRCNRSVVGLIACDAIRIRQIVMNLTSNAIKFTEQGGVEIEYSLQNTNRLVLSVKDSGPGIEQSKLNTIFDEFVREEKAEGVEGSGLGLAVVRGAVLLLGGSVLVESQEQQGSIFTVSIPVEQADEKSESMPVKMTPLTILIVDDDPLQLRMMSEMMTRSSHTVHCTSKFKEAIKLVANQPIDLVLTDLQMGAFSGYKLLHEIRSKGYTMPVVAVSASDRVNKTELKKAGFTDFLCKPFFLSQLNLIVTQNARKPEIASICALMEGDQEAVKEIMDLFVKTTIEHIELLKEYLNDHKMEQARKLCHKMLPMFLQLQLNEIAQLLKEVDAGDVDSAKIERIITLTQDVITQYRTA